MDEPVRGEREWRAASRAGHRLEGGVVSPQHDILVGTAGMAGDVRDQFEPDAQAVDPRVDGAGCLQDVHRSGHLPRAVKAHGNLGWPARVRQARVRPRQVIHMHAVGAQLHGQALAGLQVGVKTG